MIKAQREGQIMRTNWETEKRRQNLTRTDPVVGAVRINRALPVIISIFCLVMNIFSKWYTEVIIFRQAKNYWNVASALIFLGEEKTRNKLKLLNPWPTTLLSKYFLNIFFYPCHVLLLVTAWHCYQHVHVASYLTGLILFTFKTCSAVMPEWTGQTLTWP